jgi:hypothetical protein
VAKDVSQIQDIGIGSVDQQFENWTWFGNWHAM